MFVALLRIQHAIRLFEEKPAKLTTRLFEESITTQGWHAHLRQYFLVNHPLHPCLRRAASFGDERASVRADANEAIGGNLVLQFQHFDMTGLDAELLQLTPRLHRRVFRQRLGQNLYRMPLRHGYDPVPVAPRKRAARTPRVARARGAV